MYLKQFLEEYLSDYKAVLKTEHTKKICVNIHLSQLNYNADLVIR